MEREVSSRIVAAFASGAAHVSTAALLEELLTPERSVHWVTAAHSPPASLWLTLLSSFLARDASAAPAVGDTDDIGAMELVSGVWACILKPSLCCGDDQFAAEVVDAGVAFARWCNRTGNGTTFWTVISPLLMGEWASLSLPLSRLCLLSCAVLPLAVASTTASGLFVAPLIDAVFMHLQGESTTVRAAVAITMLPAVLPVDASCSTRLIHTIRSLLDRQGDDRHDAYSLLCQCCHLVPSLTTLPFVWRAIHDGLLDTDVNVRKRSQFLLREALFQNGFAVAAAPLTAADAAALHVDEYWRAVMVERLSTPSQLPVKWEVYLALLESLEDFPLHLIDEMWPHHAALFDDDAHVTSADVWVEGVCVPSVATPGHIPFYWASVALSRAFNSVSPTVKRRCLLLFLQGAAGHAPANVHWHFVTGELMTALDDPTLYKSVTEDFRGHLRAYTAAYIGGLRPESRRDFFKAFVGRLSKGLRCEAALRSLLGVMATCLPSVTSPIDCLSADAVECIRTLVWYVNDSMLPSVQQELYPQIVALLTRFGVASVVGVDAICRVLSELQPVKIVSPALVTPLQAWLTTDTAWLRDAVLAFSTAFVTSTAACDAWLPMSFARLCFLASGGVVDFMDCIEPIMSHLQRMYTEVYMNVVTKQRLLQWLDEALLLASRGPAFVPVVQCVIEKADDSLAGVLRGRILSTAVGVGGTGDAEAGAGGFVDTTPTSTCLRILRSILQAFPASTAHSSLTALCDDIISHCVHHITAIASRRVTQVEPVVGLARAMQSLASLVEFVGAVFTSDAATRMLQQLFSVSIGKPHSGASDIVLAHVGFDAVDEHLQWMHLLSDFQEWKWLTIASLMTRDISGVPTDMLTAWVDDAVDALLVVPESSVPCVIVCVRELAVTLWYRGHPSVDNDAITHAILNTVDAAQQNKLSVCIVRAVSSLILHPVLVTRPGCTDVLLPLATKFMKRLGRPPQVSQQVATSYFCSALLALAEHAVATGTVAAPLFQYVDVTAFLVAHKEDAEMGEEFLLCTREEREGLLKWLDDGELTGDVRAFVAHWFTAARAGEHQPLFDMAAEMPTGAGAVVRIQLLCTLDAILAPTAVQSSPVLLAFAMAVARKLLDSVTSPEFLELATWNAYGPMLRTWQALALLSEHFGRDDALTFCKDAQVCMLRLHASAVRQYMDCVMTRALLRFPVPAIDELLIPLLNQYGVNKQTFTSAVLVASYVLAELVKRDLSPGEQGACQRIVIAVLPWSLSSYGSVRSMAHRTIMAGAKLFDAVDGGALGMQALTSGFAKFLRESEKSGRVYEKHLSDFTLFKPDDLCSLRGIIRSQPDENGDLIPDIIVDSIVATVNDAVGELRECDTGLFSVPPSAVTAVSAAAPAGSADGQHEDTRHAAKRIESVFNFQKKRTPWEDIAWSSCDDAAITALTTKVSPVLSWLDPKGRPCQPLIVFASFVNRTPNLGGLARTCEIFRAETLVVHDLAVKEDQQFRSLSVSAYEWTHMEQQAEGDVLQYIAGKKREGYTVVGLEQAQTSVPLECTVFPEKVLLVLGREKEGVPVEVINALDMCVEIPQFGVIRSLNVHVSASLLLWEYTRQRVLRGLK